MKKLMQQDYIDAANLLNVEIASIKAVAEVESAGDGFIDDKNPKILFEPFIFGRITKHKYDSTTVNIGGILYPISLKGKWSAKSAKYGKTSIQYQKLEFAIKLDNNAALKSCSWGKFQILGQNYYSCGYNSVELFVVNMYKSEKYHLDAFCKFIKSNNSLYKSLQNKNWEKFAEGYNGTNYKQNKYDIKLKEAYEKYKLQQNNVKITNFENVEPLPIIEIPPIEPKEDFITKIKKIIIKIKRGIL